MNNPFYLRFMDQVGPVEVGSPPSRGDFLRAYDPDYMNGKGQAHWTKSYHKALAFESTTEAVAVWRMQSIVKPLRADGKPNRPLTSCTLVITREVGPL